jgi:Tol biopolymer transport system component
MAKSHRPVALFNIVPLAWPYWAWGMGPTGWALLAVVLAGGYLWNVFVLAGLLLMLGQTDRVGQRSLLAYAFWVTLAGGLADVAHALLVDGLLRQVDFLTVPDPLGIIVSTLGLPAILILLANLALCLVLLRLSPRHSFAVALGMAALTVPWLALGAIDVGRQIVAREALTGFLASIGLLALTPWLLHGVAVWARSRRRSRALVQSLALALVTLTLAGIGLGSCQAPLAGQEGGLPGELAFAARERVYLMDGGSGQKRVLTGSTGDLIAWEPGSEGILVQRQAAGDANPPIYLLSTRDGSYTQLAGGRVLANAWSSDGRSLLFTVDRANQESLVMRLRLGEAPAEVGDGAAPTWSPDGKRIALSVKQGGRAQVWVCHPDGSDRIQLTSDGGENPTWSPDGGYIAYTFSSRVYVMDSDGLGKRQLTTGVELFDQSPLLAWSPDGGRLAYANFRPALSSQPSVIYVVNVDSSDKTKISGSYQPPLAWSPNGEWLATVRNDEIWGIFLPATRTAGSAPQERRLSPGTGFVWGGDRPRIMVKPAPTYPPTPTPVPLPPAVVESPDILVINPRNTTTMYAGTSQGVIKRTESGGWVAAAVGILFPLRVRAIALDPTNPSVLYAGTDGERSEQGGTLYRSVDGGARWTATKLKNLDVYAILVDLLSPSIVYAGTLKGVYKSVDAGANWQAAGAGLKTTAVQALAIDPTPPKGVTPGASLTLYAGTRQGEIYRSTDGAATWALVGSADVPVTSITASAKPGVVFAATAEGLYRTSDGGAHWAPMAGGIWKFKLDGVVVDPKKPDVVYVVGPRGIFKSPDGGDNWGPVGFGLAGTQPTTLAIDPNDNLLLYAGTDKGVFKSTNMGITWDR